MANKITCTLLQIENTIYIGYKKNQFIENELIVFAMYGEMNNLIETGYVKDIDENFILTTTQGPIHRANAFSILEMRNLSIDTDDKNIKDSTIESFLKIKERNPSKEVHVDVEIEFDCANCDTIYNSGACCNNINNIVPKIDADGYIVATLKKDTLSVVVGRFQTPYLTLGHKYLINEAIKGGGELLIILGNHTTQPTKRNPLNDKIRELMLEEEYPDANIRVLHDHADDIVWSQELDNLIYQQMDIDGFEYNVKLYASRDSFAKYYFGKFDVVEIESPISEVSATEVRRQSANEIIGNEDFRRGIIYGIHNRFASPYLTVDIAMIDRANVLLCRKSGENGWRFIGGYVDSTDANIEDAAHRELMEEASSKQSGQSLFVDDFEIIGTTKIDSWKYAKDEENIFTVFYACQYISGMVEANDDIIEVKWFAFNDIYSDRVVFVPEHQKLKDLFIKFIQKK